MKRQTMTMLAKPSIAESSPKPISATEPAMIPATIAMLPSRPIQMRLIQERIRALRAAASHSALGCG